MIAGVAPVSASAAALEQSMSRLVHVLLRDIPPGLSRSAASVLARLRDAGPQRITDLAAWESVAQPSMTTLVGRLAEQGLVERRPDPADGRAVLVAITDAGRARLRDRQAARTAALERRMRVLAPDERALLVRAAPLLQRLADADPTPDGPSA
jgi:DNA-binding MarR family transcriptional regulator